MTCKSLAVRLVCALSMLLACATAPATVCRNPYIDGMETVIDRTKTLLGPDTTDIRRIKLFISSDKGVPFVQSNFRSANPDKPGEFSDYPTKIREKGVDSIESALLNIIFWSTPPDNADAIVREALDHAEIFVDSKAFDQSGRLHLTVERDIKVRLAADGQPVTTGELKLLHLKKPPPALTEVISGCCVRGRPPGHGTRIMASLKERPFKTDDFTFFSMVVDSGTTATIMALPALRSATDRIGTLPERWADRLDTALTRSADKNLVVMGHIEGKDVVVTNARQEVLYSIPIAQLRAKAREHNVDLLLLGCDTAAFIERETAGLGIAGVFNTAAAARKLEAALTNSSSVADVVTNMASTDFVFVAYEEKGGYGYAGASVFAKVAGESHTARIFRLLALRKKGQ
ncbi:hypothetical protein [Massilia sp. YMA4]|uniref:hypothetical protein n=1 Tax=Massilia sp. YMA4 TaxID=1593482 RepID=UPI00158152F8|nr:hypothetical protein [Massilia sp. YMA4]